MDTHYNLLNALAEKLELHRGRDSTVGWNCVSGMKEVPGKHSQGANDFAQASGIFIYKQGVLYNTSRNKIMNVQSALCRSNVAIMSWHFHGH